MREVETIAIIGGTGSLGNGFARRWAIAGKHIIIGSRRPEKARTSASEIFRSLAAFADIRVTGEENATAAARADIVLLTVPFSSHLETLQSIASSLRGKILIDATVPLNLPKIGTVRLPPRGSAAADAQEVLNGTADVVSAFQNVPAALLQTDKPIDCDVLVCGNSRGACEVVIRLAPLAGVRGIYAGPIENSSATEALTSLLITINRAYKCHAGIRLTGLP